MMTTTLSAQQISFARDGNVILDNADLTLSQGELVGLIGPNGAGKSSLLRMMAGLQQP
ncbi:MAG TPA: ABC transporter ATP-binding protein, partial [Cellvibrio sp.]